MPDLLPPNATNQERDLSLSLNRLPAVPIKTLWTPQTCPEGQLPWLAWALSVDEWDATWPVETKRSVIAGSIEQHRKKGTVGALRNALQRLGYEVEIDENTGVAYTFRLRFKVREGESLAGAVLDQAVTKATAIAIQQKNARSELIDFGLMGEGGDAVVWNGGVTVSGAEVEIKTPGSSLPLDDWPDYMLGSYWTVRMHSTYTGPIARVRRDSDGAELNYMSVGELASFTEGETDWYYLKFFNQRGRAGAASTLGLVSNCNGGFDANGVPCIYNSTHFSASISAQRISAMTAVVAFDAFSSYAPLIFNRLGAHVVKLESGSFSGDRVKFSTPSGNVLIQADSPTSILPYLLRLSGTAIHLADGVVYSASNVTTIEPPMMETLDLFQGVEAGRNCYGAAIWRRDLGADEGAAIQSAVASKLSL